MQVNILYAYLIWVRQSTNKEFDGGWIEKNEGTDLLHVGKLSKGTEMRGEKREGKINLTISVNANTTCFNMN